MIAIKTTIQFTTAPYRALFFGTRTGLRQVACVGILARLSLGMTPLAILLTIRAASRSFALAGTVAGAYAFGGVLAPLGGRLLDRFGSRPVIVSGALVNASLLVTLGFVAHAGSAPIVTVTVAILGGATIPPISAAMRVLWPQVALNATLLQAANAFEAVSFDLLWTIGPLIVAVLAGFFTPMAALFTAAGLELLGSLWFVSLLRGDLAIRCGRRQQLPGVPRRWAIAPFASFLCTNGLVAAGLGMLEVALLAFAQVHDAIAFSGVMVAAFSIASFVGGIWYGAHRWLTPPPRRYVRLISLFSLLLASLGLVAISPLLIVFIFPAGFAFSPVVACGYGLVTDLAPQRSLGEANSWLTASTVLGLAVGISGAGVLVDYLAIWMVFIAAGLSGLVGAALFKVTRQGPNKKEFTLCTDENEIKTSVLAESR